MDLIKTFQCETCEQDVKIDFRRFHDSWDFDVLSSSCTCKILYIDYFAVQENKVDGGIRIEGRIVGHSEYSDLAYAGIIE